MKTRMFLETDGRKVDVQKVLDSIKENIPKVSKLDVYLKPEENRAYYVADGKTFGDDCFVSF